MIRRGLSMIIFGLLAAAQATSRHSIFDILRFSFDEISC